MRNYLQAFLKEKPFFFSIIRPKEASLYQPYRPFKKPILDIGCGDGFFAKLAFEKVDVGLDIKSSEIDEAKRWKVYKVIKEYDGRKIPYPDNYFSTIVCNSTFEHIPNLSEVLSEVSRVLKKGGMLYFTVPTDAWPSYLFGRLLLGRIYDDYFRQAQKHYNLYSFKKWQAQLEKVKLRVVKHQYYLNNKKILWLFDISHYLSISSLLTKKILGRWVLFPRKEMFFPQLKNYILKETESNSRTGSCVFIAAKKI